MRDCPAGSDPLWPTTFVFRARNAVLRPHFHCHADDVVALLAQQITGNAGVDSTAHTEKDALFFSAHFEGVNFRQLAIQSMYQALVRPEVCRVWSAVRNRTAFTMRGKRREYTPQSKRPNPGPLQVS